MSPRQQPSLDAYRVPLNSHEQYDDQAAFQAHCDSPHFKATVEAEVFPRLTDRRLEIYESL